MIPWTEQDGQDTLAAAGRIPVHLYRYIPFRNEQNRARAQQAIQNGELFFASASKFNDPFEGSLEFDSSADADTVRKFWADTSAARAVAPSERAATIEAHVQRATSGDSTYSATTGQIARGLLERYGMLCLCEDPASILMWSYYASGHTGICLRFRMSNRAWFDLSGHILPMEVAYVDAGPVIRFYYTRTFEFCSALLATKASVWGHEREWRIVLPDRVGLVTLPPSVCDGVIFGMRTSSDDKELIRGWIAARKDPVELYEARRTLGKYTLEIPGLNLDNLFRLADLETPPGAEPGTDPVSS